jgi:hypothetical protein
LALPCPKSGVQIPAPANPLARFLDARHPDQAAVNIGFLVKMPRFPRSASQSALQLHPSAACGHLFSYSGLNDQPLHGDAKK